MHRGCLVCAICNSNSFCSFIFKLCVMIVHILKICTFYFVHNLWIFSHFLGLLDLDFFPFKMHRGYLVCVISYSNKCFFPYIQTLHIDCAHIEYVHILFCAQFMNIFSFLGLLDLKFFQYVQKFIVRCVRPGMVLSHLAPLMFSVFISCKLRNFILLEEPT